MTLAVQPVWCYPMLEGISSLSVIEEVLEEHPETLPDSLLHVEGLIADLQEKLLNLESIEQEVWTLLAKEHGQVVRRKCAEEWAYWSRQITAKVGDLRKECLRRKLKPLPPVPVLTPAVASSSVSHERSKFFI